MVINFDDFLDQDPHTKPEILEGYRNLGYTLSRKGKIDPANVQQAFVYDNNRRCVGELYLTRAHGEEIYVFNGKGH